MSAQEILTALRPPPDAIYLTIEEAAAHYRKTVRVMRQWRQSGYGPGAVKAGKSLLYPIAEIKRFDRELAQAAAR